MASINTEQIDLVQAPILETKNICKFENCKVRPKKGEWCSKHAYRKTMGKCQHIKADGTICDGLTSKIFCKVHCFDRTPNKCAYVGAINGPCKNSCKGIYCATHNPKSIKIRNDTTKEYSKMKYSEMKTKKALINELVKDFEELKRVNENLPEGVVIYEKLLKLQS